MPGRHGTITMGVAAEDLCTLPPSTQSPLDAGLGIRRPDPRLLGAEMEHQVEVGITRHLVEVVRALDVASAVALEGAAGLVEDDVGRAEAHARVDCRRVERER